MNTNKLESAVYETSERGDRSTEITVISHADFPDEKTYCIEYAYMNEPSGCEFAQFARSAEDCAYFWLEDGIKGGQVSGLVHYAR